MPSCVWKSISKPRPTWKEFNLLKGYEPQTIIEKDASEQALNATKAKERIDKRSLSDLIIDLPYESFKALRQAWKEKPSLDPAEMRNMLLEEKQQWEESRHSQLLLDLDARKLTSSDAKDQDRIKYPECGKHGHPGKDCWIKHLEKAPNWLKEIWRRKTTRRLERDRKSDEKINDVPQTTEKQPTLVSQEVGRNERASELIRSRAERQKVVKTPKGGNGKQDQRGRKNKGKSGTRATKAKQGVELEKEGGGKLGGMELEERTAIEEIQEIRPSS